MFYSAVPYCHGQRSLAMVKYRKDTPLLMHGIVQRRYQVFSIPEQYLVQVEDVINSVACSFDEVTQQLRATQKTEQGNIDVLPVQGGRKIGSRLYKAVSRTTYDTCAKQASMLEEAYQAIDESYCDGIVQRSTLSLTLRRSFDERGQMKCETLNSTESIDRFLQGQVHGKSISVTKKKTCFSRGKLVSQKTRESLKVVVTSPQGINDCTSFDTFETCLRWIPELKGYKLISLWSTNACPDTATQPRDLLALTGNAVWLENNFEIPRSIHLLRKEGWNISADVLREVLGLPGVEERKSFCLHKNEDEFLPAHQVVVGADNSAPFIEEMDNARTSCFPCHLKSRAKKTFSRCWKRVSKVVGRIYSPFRPKAKLIV